MQPLGVVEGAGLLLNGHLAVLGVVVREEDSRWLFGLAGTSLVLSAYGPQVSGARAPYCRIVGYTPASVSLTRASKA
jgi:hypothetical protein